MTTKIIKILLYGFAGTAFLVWAFLSLLLTILEPANNPTETFMNYTFVVVMIAVLTVKLLIKKLPNLGARLIASLMPMFRFH